MQYTEDGNEIKRISTEKKNSAITRQRVGWDDLKILILFLCFVLAIEGTASGLWSYSVNGLSVANDGKPLSGWGVFAIGMICSGAASLVGGLLGFLFGIPRSSDSSVVGSRRLSNTTASSPPEVVSQSAPASPDNSSATRLPSATASALSLRVNTNLEDISDFVTKALLGAGLVAANALVDGAGKLAVFLGPSFGPGSAGQAFAIATIIYGALEGFLAGYLATRLYLTAAFGRNDPQRLAPMQNSLPSG
jgi:hypothetical protein